MDSVTHALTGAVIGGAIYNEGFKRNNTAFLTFSAATVLGAIAPDIDFIARQIGGDTFYFINHRGITHSPFAVIVLSLLCAFAVKIIKRDQNYKILFLGALCGTVSHVLLDLTNVYSTLALWPFSDKMYSFNLTPYGDKFIFYLYIISIVIAILLTYIKPLRPWGRKIFILTLAVVMGYVGIRAYIQNDVKSSVLSDYEKGSLIKTHQQQKVEKILVMARSEGMHAWNFIIENEQAFIKGSVNSDKGDYYNITTVIKKEKGIPVQKALNTPIGRFFLRFSPSLDYEVSKFGEGYLVRITDLRYTFSRSLTGQQASGYSRSGYILLDGKYKVTGYSIRPPVKLNR